MKLQTSTHEHALLSAETPADVWLLQACRAGNDQAWLQLLNKYDRLVYSIPLNYGLGEEDAADITQIVFMALIQSLHTLQDDSNLGSWLALLTRRHTWRTLQRQHRLTQEELNATALQLLFHGEPRIGARWALVERLHRVLLTTGYWCSELLIALYFTGGFPSDAEVARAMGIAEASIRPRCAQCLRQLKQLFTA